MSEDIKKTYTAGYFNGNRWPIQIFISKHNLQLLLQPNEFVTDSTGRRINDPLFDNYKQLSKEMSKAPVALVAIPESVALPKLPGGNAVYGTDQVTVNAKGQKVPVVPSTPPPPPNAINAGAVRGMSIEEARNAGLIGKVKVVPEDYGITDTDGAPRSAADIPPMKISHESQPKVNSLGKLNEELVNAVTTAKGDQAARRTLQQTITQGTRQASSVLTETGYIKAAQAKVKTAQGVQTVTSIPVAEPEPEINEDSLPVEDALPESIDSSLPAPPEDAAEETIQVTQSVKPIIPPPIAKKFACADCGETFVTRSQFGAHVNMKHKNNAKALLATYPAGESI